MNPKIIKLDPRRLLSLDLWRSFFMGNVYPIAVCALVFLGNVTALDYYFNFLITAVAIFALFLTDSVKPIIITVCTYIYQISIPHAPSYPTYSDFFFSGWRAPATVILIVCVGAAFSVFFFKRGIHRKLTPKRTPLLIPLSAFSIALIFNGVFSSDWISGNLIFAILNIIVYFFWFLILYHGMDEKENVEKLADYFSYVSLLISFVIVLELACLYIWGNVIVDGEITKVSVALGWGIWNVIGTSLAVLIGPLFWGVMNNRYPWLYFFGATLTLLAAIFSMSRNALIFASLAYVVSVIIACFFGKHKKAFRIISVVGILVIILTAIIFWGKISELLSDYFDRGLSDNGRYDLWKLALQTFEAAPIFGNGFYGFFTDAVFEFGNVPRMAHNTILELLSATGILGAAAYLYYRVSTAIAFFKRPSLMKTYFGISVAALILGGMLDNFMFNIHPVLYYSVIIAIVFKANESEGKDDISQKL